MTRVIVSSTHRPLRLLLVEDADDYAALVSARLAAAHEPPEAIRFAELDDALRHAERLEKREFSAVAASGFDEVLRRLGGIAAVPSGRTIRPRATPAAPAPPPGANAAAPSS